MRILQFDEIVIDVGNMEVRKGSHTVELEPNFFRVLVYLAENANRVVTKEELLKEVWNGAFVTDNALTRVIAQLRKALGDDAKQARYIETVPTVGYRFLADVRIQQPDQPVPEPQPPAYVPRRINWWIPIGAFSAILLAYLMPFIKIWTSGGPPVLKPVQFTTAGGLDLHPSFSPDGSNLTYASDKSGNFEIYVMQVVPGGREIQLTKDGQENLQPAWSPDGSSIAYTSVKNRGIFVIPALGGMPRRVTDMGSQPAWFPDGKQIAFRDEGVSSAAFPEVAPGTQSTVWTVPAQGGTPKQITHPGAPEGRHSNPQISPDGRRLGFLSFEFMRLGGIRELDLWTGELSSVNTAPALAISFVYGPDGGTMFFLGMTDKDTSGLYQLVKGRPPELLMRVDFTHIRDLTLTSRGNRAGYSASAMASNLWQVSPKTGETRQVTHESAYRFTQSVFSPDGTRLAYLMRLRGLTGDLYISDANGGNATQVTRNPAWNYLVSWMPDGKSIVYQAQRDGESGLFQFSLQDGSEKKFARIDNKVGISRLSPDGKELVYQQRDGTVDTIWKMEIASGKKTQLTFPSHSISYPCWSADGKWIAAESRQGADSHLVVLSAKGGAVRQLTNRPGHAWVFSWSPDGREIAVAGFWDAVWNVYAVNFETGDARKLTENKLFRTFMRYPSWSPKGDPIVFERNETKGNIFLADMPQ
ncbi:MAG TPA: winged helix-turn-helix domain-containing protein [Bryobacteraceae bacterium]|nr:winged helix-turn-helix domain-containing protein [Bryobacteraceae bacterium]